MLNNSLSDEAMETRADVGQRRRRTLVSKCLRILVVSFSDQQLATGLSLAIAARYLLVKSLLDVYHLRITVGLLWLSISTHTASLMTMLKVLPSDMHYSSTSRNSETETVTGILLFLRLALIYTTIFGQTYLSEQLWGTLGTRRSESWGCPATCIEFGSGEEVSRIGPATLVMVICFYYYPVLFALAPLARIIKARRRSVSNPRQNWISSRPKSLSRKILAIGSLLLIVSGLVLGCTIVGTTIYDSSVIFDKQEARIERAWNFGQIVPVTLLVLPLLSVLTAYVGKFTPPEVPAQI